MGRHKYVLTHKVYNPNMGIEYHDDSGDSHYIFACENYLQDWKAMVGDKVKIESDDTGHIKRVWVNGVLVYRSLSQRMHTSRMMRWVASRKARIMITEQSD